MGLRHFAGRHRQLNGREGMCDRIVVVRRCKLITLAARSRGGNGQIGGSGPPVIWLSGA